MASALRIVVPFALYAAALAALYALSPWRPAFDDAFHIQDGIRWMQHGQLNSDGLFLRVPLWPVLLGSTFSALGVRAGLICFQAAVVLGAIALYVGNEKKHEATSSSARWLIVAAFVLSPQILFYSRHAVNELWIGLLAMVVMSLGARLDGPRACALGAVVALATMTKLVGFALALPVAIYVLRSGSGRWRRAALCGGGFAVIFLPLLWLHVSQHGSFLLDNTGAYQLSSFTLGEWRSFDGAQARQAAGVASFFDSIGGSPLAYLGAFFARSVEWIVHPSSADLASFFPALPHTPIRIADAIVFLAFFALALLGTTARTAPIWLFVAAVWLASTFPPHTPYTPKTMLLFPWLLLAPKGARRIASWPASRRLTESAEADRDH